MPTLDARAMASTRARHDCIARYHDFRERSNARALPIADAEVARAWLARCPRNL